MIRRWKRVRALPAGSGSGSMSALSVGGTQIQPRSRSMVARRSSAARRLPRVAFVVRMTKIVPWSTEIENRGTMGP